jgi:NitT/TauT family transport system ATP-binding protein
VFEKAVMLLVKALAKALAGGWKDAEAVSQDANGSVADEQNGVVQHAESDKTDKKSEVETSKGICDKAEESGRWAVSQEQEGFGLYNVTKRFADKTVLSDFSVWLAPGETVALMGASGCGKSTAGKLMLGLLQADAGEVKRPKRLGAVFQEDRLCMEFDAVTNIAMVTGDRRMAEIALAEVGLADIKGKSVAALSGGMKRRVAIVRALLSDGELLVFDEPFTGLDTVNKQQVMGYVKERLQGRSVLLITHSEAEVTGLADRVIRIPGWDVGKVSDGAE